MIMAYRYGERNQIPLFTESLDGSISKDDPVRAYDAFIEALDFKELGIVLDDNKIGNSEYDPKAMMKLIVYAYSYGWRSSRKIERALHHNFSFVWIVGGLKPDYKTIAEYRRRNKKAIKKLLKLCVRMCISLKLIEGNTLFVDGTKIRANAARSKSYTKAKYEKMLPQIDERIDKLIKECENTDRNEKNQESLVKMNKELANEKELKSRIEDLIDEFKKEGSKTKDGKERKKNLTDPECQNMRSIQGTHADYNIQAVGDNKNRLLVNVDATSNPLDKKEFSKQIKKAEEVTEKECQTACGDSGYADTDDLEEIDKRGTKVIVPSQRQALHGEEKPFSKSEFKYDEEEDCYDCPEGKRLRYKGLQEEGKKLVYEIEETEICKQCPHYGKCTTSKTGRRILRLKKEKLKEKLEKQYEEEESQEIYEQRKCTIEHPFGHIKRNLGMTSFLLRGTDGVQAEIVTAATCFNIVRMITLLGGVQKFIFKISHINSKK